ncbi:hypothetical protein ACI797_05690 [Geodermatophilus sp. SYSU D00691]
MVLSHALSRRDRSPRWREVAHPSPRPWVHHLEVHDPREVDDEVAGWLREAVARAGAAGAHRRPGGCCATRVSTRRASRGPASELPVRVRDGEHRLGARGSLRVPLSRRRDGRA